ncbi:MAG: ferredoxin reductase family protein [Candidatus Omnitrophota bacterium]
MKRVLPCLFFIANFLMVSFFWFLTLQSRLTAHDTNFYLEAGRLTGLWGTYAILSQFLLLSGAPWVERAWGFDWLTRVHRWVGYFAAVCILSHPAFLAFGFASGAGQSFWGQLAQFMTWKDMLPAGVAYGVFVVVLFMLFERVRKAVKYEVWFLIHAGIYGVILLAFAHELTIGADLTDSHYFKWYWGMLYGLFLGVFFYFRLLRPVFYLCRHGLYVQKVVKETEDAVSVYIGGRDLRAFKITAGQFFMPRFLAKGFWFEAHPFSFSCAHNPDYLRVTVKKLGDYTARLPLLPPGTPVMIDGPFGIFTVDRTKRDKVLLIGGGVGVAPIRSVAEKFADMGKDVAIFYGNQNLRTIALKAELDELMRRYAHVKAYYVMYDDPAWEGRKGFITADLIRELCPDAAQRDAFVCGPPLMMKSMLKILPDLGISRERIYYERFSF